jgi:hypothetical protein
MREVDSDMLYGDLVEAQDARQKGRRKEGRKK